MGKVCDGMVGASEALWYWVYPEHVAVPDCVLELLKRLYPTVDWSTVTFHKGIPWIYRLGNPEGITLPADWGLHEIHICIREDVWDFCSCHGLMRFVHEAFHVLQYRDVLDGWGLGFLRPFMIVYLACSFSDDEWGINDVERPAYEQGNHYEQCCYLHGGIVCDCHNDPPTFNAAALDGLVANCPELVRTSSGFTFWKMVWGCVPGLSKLWDWTQELIQKACKFDWQPGRTPEGLPGPSQPTWNDVQRFFASCMWAILAWLILRFIALLYYAVWLAIWTLLTIIAGIIKTAIEVIIIAVDVLLWVVTTIVCGAEWLWDKIKEGFQAACNWGTKTKKSCEQWGEQYRQECTATEEQSTQECTQKEDQGHQDCCDWWPCSWACDAWVWVSHWVCVAWAWVTKTVCVAWSWVAESVCVAFTWVVIKVTCW